MTQTAETGAQRGVPRPTAHLITALFFLSGAAGLVYQVLWMRHLGLFLGSDMYGVSIILGTFMGGLALGSLVGGFLGERTRRPLLFYGLAEIGIGSFALVFATLLRVFEPVLGAMYPDDVSEPSLPYHLLRIALASGSLLVPTTLMGATLPLILRHFVRTRSVVGELAAFFYAANTLGALVGTLVAGFVLLPYLGMTRSTALVAALNLAIGFTCIVIGARSPLPAQSAPQPGEDTREDPLPEMDARQRRRIARAALLALGFSGFGSFALEVVWTRILLISFSATVYSFASMLACFLAGIFLGSMLVRRVVDEHEDPLQLFAHLELGTGLSVAALCLLINAVPGFFSGLLRVTAALLPEGSDAALIVATLVASFLLLVAPTTLLGATFSVALRTYTMNVSKIASRTGNLYFSNTFGAILGSIVGGLILVPALGTRLTLAAIAVLFSAIGVYLFVSSPGARRPGAKRIPALFAGATVAGAAIAVALPYRVTLNFNQNAGAETQLVYHGEGIQNIIDVVRSRSGVTSLIIGGNVEADDGDTQKSHFVLKGHLPLLFLEPPIDVLVVGLGMGITLNATARHEGVERIDVVELSPEILDAQRELRQINDDIVNNPLVHIRIDDGRTYMRMNRNQYDMITADPIHPKVSRVGYLYTREYYESIRARLDEHGVVCQWMPLYQISPRRLRSAMKSFIEVFPHATFWYVKGHGLFVAKQDSAQIDFELLRRKLAEQPAVREDLASIGIESPEELIGLLLLGPDEIRAFVAADGGAPSNTDDYPYLEYFVPRDLFARPLANVQAILEHAVDPTRYMVNQPEESVARVQELLTGRSERLVEELSGGHSTADTRADRAPGG
jgi:spermidine synthase